MSVLVVGGRGYIGSALTEYLKTQGIESQSVDLCWFGDYTDYGNIKTDFNSIPASALESYDTIVLLAGHSSVQMCENDYYSSFNNNVRNFLGLVSKIKQTKPSIRFIYASSSSLYGDTNNSVAGETYSNYTCNNNYDLTKYFIDSYMMNARDNGEPLLNDWYGLRFATVNGPSPNTRVDLMINSMVHSALSTDEIHISNKHINRPIVGLNDLCRAIYTIITTKTSNPGIYNLSSFNSSVDIISNIVSEITSARVIDSGLKGVPYNFMISTNKFEKAFNFKFTDNAESITFSLLDNNGLKTKRGESVHYD